MKDQWQRILTLDRWLRAGRNVVAKDAAKELGVGERTIRRDLVDILRGEWKLPLRYDRGQRVWFYEGAAAPIVATVVSESDRFALLLSLQSIEQYRATPIYKKLKQIYARLLEMMPVEKRTSFKELAKKIRFEGPPMPSVAEITWNTIINALDDNTTLELIYHTGRSGEVHQRQVDPYGLVVRHREWYLVGWDHMRKAVRTFFLPRIQKADDTEGRFQLKDKFDLDNYLSTAIDGHQSTGQVHRVRLRFSREAAAIGEDYVWNATQKASMDKQHRVIVEFDTGALYAVERQVLEIISKHHF